MEGTIDVQKNLIRSYRDLRVWQEAIDLAEACYRATREFPKEELYGMTSQMRRAAVSVAANIAEGHGRDGRGEFVQFLRVAQGSLKELETRLLLSQRVEMASAKTVGPVLGRCEATGKMLRALIRSLQKKGVAISQ